MVVDQNFPKVKKYLLSIILIILFSSKSFSENFKYTKIVKLKNPWSATFINNNEIIITEKEGKIKIIGVGGVDSGQSAYEKITAGADAVQLYTGMVYKGPGIVKEIKKDLISILKKENIRNISEAIGINA